MLNTDIYQVTDKFVETMLFRHIKMQFNMARDTGLSLHIIGNAGTGKTTTLRRLAMQEKHCAYCQAAPHINTPAAILRAIDVDLGQASASHQLHKISPKIIRQMRDPFEDTLEPQRFVLMIDEAQHLTGTAIRTVQDLVEKAKAVLILAGNHQELADRDRLSNEALAQIQTRIWARLSTDQPMERADIERISNAYGVGEMDAYDFCVAFAAKNTVRDLVHMLQAARGYTAAGKAIALSELKIVSRIAGRGLDAA